MEIFYLFRIVGKNWGQVKKDFKRETAYKIRIGDLLRGNQIFEETEALNKRLLHVELGNKKLIRVNIIANVIDKFESESESRFATITLDDGSGQIRARVFGEDVNKFKELIQGDTIVIIGFVRSYNQELYILPEIIKKITPKYLLIRNEYRKTLFINCLWFTIVYRNL